MKILLLISLLCLVSCKTRTIEQKEQITKVKNDFYQDCINIGDMYRCENKEVICYYAHGVESIALQCKFKGYR